MRLVRKTVALIGPQTRFAQRLGRVVLILLLSLMANATTPEKSFADLIAFYDFEGDAFDVSGHGQDGTVFGDVQLTSAGFLGMAYEFGGTSGGTLNDYIQLPFGINPSTYPQLTMGAWVNSDIIGGTTKAGKVLGHDDGSFDRTMGADFRSGGTPQGTSNWSAYAGASKGVLRSSVPVTINEWIFLATVYDQTNSTVTLYVDDKRFDQTAASLGSSSLNVTIGKSAGFGSNEAWDGRIDHVFFFDQALTESQISNIRENPNSLYSIPEPTAGSMICGILMSLVLVWNRIIFRQRFWRNAQ